LIISIHHSFRLGGDGIIPILRAQPPHQRVISLSSAGSPCPAAACGSVAQRAPNQGSRQCLPSSKPLTAVMLSLRRQTNLTSCSGQMPSERDFRRLRLVAMAFAFSRAMQDPGVVHASSGGDEITSEEVLPAIHDDASARVAHAFPWHIHI